jgi:hypothetical protein
MPHIQSKTLSSQNRFHNLITSDQGLGIGEKTRETKGKGETREKFFIVFLVSLLLLVPSKMTSDIKIGDLCEF